MKAIWKGNISFGLVNIPIRLYSGTSVHRVELDMIRKKDHCAIQYVRVCKKDGKEVPWDDIAKGYKKKMAITSFSTKLILLKQCLKKRRRLTFLNL
ncbi:Ku protein [Flavobacterium sp. 3HN19-14]|uniref:Ku protein n=1 Tax=Flavobacterium sp. 3HN19-14 TaxID=3448133 RepID=UPI003EE173D4